MIYSYSVVHSKVVHQCCTESNGYNMMAGLEYFNHKEHGKSCIGIFNEKYCVSQYLGIAEYTYTV